ncbi:exodeoxyribonuclease V subunit gamma [Acidovorax sp. SRB_14]|uniref:exodeoxyribonuclease V subunit gamma n=1 Tax=Acidovorax sp. SRB_14 TaxID=1962699 RepID=UPI001565DDF7|nr:exodeoxyribonuclease V subunit gamma [Acidovorax sp. SRB_14]NMM81346.1 exodeoxyribonuclease V subunit gamma [Acidovorax sp. SRB_14]
MEAARVNVPLQSGLLALHSNRTETLSDTVFAWLRQRPLAPLEEEVVLVQSNGMAEWFKMALARSGGVCAATRVELPSRFLWRTYRQVLGREQVPAQSPVDKTALTWRLMRHLPGLLAQPGFEPVAGFLRSGEPERLLQLAARLADLFDQYQVYRPDWLEAWGGGRDVLAAPGRADLALPPDQRWQPMLWRAVLDTLQERERSAIRPHIHQRALGVLEGGGPLAMPVARRIVLFGMAHVPLPVLQTLAALAAHSQVLLAIPNPCRFHWADTLDGRDLLRMERRRQPLRGGRDLAAVPLEQMHVHAHPLLAAWGHQGRDFVRQLDTFDDAQQAQERFALPRIDLFDESEEAPDAPLLAQVQNRIRDLVPLAEHPVRDVDPADVSIVFHVAHSALREVEVLHDQLLQWLAVPPGGAPLQPRDVVVMVPDIETIAPAIRAVFGQYGRHDARYIPFDITDLGARASSPLVGALDWLLRLPGQRCRLSELRDLLEVPAVAARLGVSAEAQVRLAQWMVGAGIRWGLNEDQRTDLDLAACGAQNTGEFGLQRMLLGYTSGSVGFAGIEPYGEVGGLEAELAGALASLLWRLEQWRAQARTPAPPAQWAQRCRALVAGLAQATDELDRQTLDALDAAMTRWQDACAQAGFTDAVPLPVVRQAWMDTLEEPLLQQRFRAGGVTFCTLMPMRAIPFEVICLLGMNDGDYPRRAPRSDFDLMGLPGQARAGDRSRQSDDRQLMLEALLSARRVLYLSWTGRSVRDNSVQPPSVLVSQLRDYLAAGWSGDVLAQRTTEHPLQPFSRRYFEGRDGLWTHAREWRSAHAVPALAESAHSGPEEGGAASALALVSAAPHGIPVPLSVKQLARFLRHPVKTFFAERLGVVFDAAEEDRADDESFGIGGLEEYGVVRALVDGVLADMAQGPPGREGVDVAALVEVRLERLRRAGRLPLGGFAERAQRQMADVLLPLLRAWQAAQALHSEPVARQPLRWAPQDGTGAAIEDWLDPLRSGADGLPVWLELTPSRLLQDARQGTARADALLVPWVRSLAAAASGVAVHGLLVGRDATLHLAPLDGGEARATLGALLDVWRDGMQEPLPLSLRTGLALATGGDPALVYGGSFQREGEGIEPCLARVYPDFEALTGDGRFEGLAHAVYGPLAHWAATGVRAVPHAPATGPTEGATA